MTRRLRIIGVGPGDPELVTLEAVTAMRSVDFFVVVDKTGLPGKQGMPDPLVVARERLLDRHLERPPVIVRVDDPPRERRAEFTGTDEQYRAAVRAWHAARTERYREVLATHPGDAGLLVWGDPAFYDSTIRVVDELSAVMDLHVQVVPGISSVQLLAARHRLVLHEIGRPLYITTGRALDEAIATGHDNLVVMLNRGLDLDDLLDDPAQWRIWWGGNLGTADELLVSGRVGDVLERIRTARDELRERAGWVMDIYLLRRDAAEAP